MQLPAKVEQFDAATAIVNQNSVMSLQTVVMAVMRLDVVSHQKNLGQGKGSYLNTGWDCLTGLIDWSQDFLKHG